MTQVYSTLSHKQVPVFLQSPCNQIPGTIMISGNQAIFAPLDEKLITQTILLDSISKIAIKKLDNALHLVDILTNFTKEPDAIQQEQYFTLNSGPKLIQQLSHEKLSAFSQIEYKKCFLELINDPQLIIIATYSHEEIQFFGSSQNIQTMFSELAMYTMKAPIDSIEHYTEKVDSGENFHFIVFQPSFDVEQTIMQTIKNQQSENSLFIRRAVCFEPVKKGEIFNSQLLNQRKFDKNINIQWATQFPINNEFKYHKNFVKQYPKMIPVKIIFPVKKYPSDVWRLDSDMIKFARKNNQNSLETLNEAILDLLELSEPQDLIIHTTEESNFPGRYSKILNTSQFKDILTTLHLSCHQQLYLQYCSALDGRFLGNLYSSFDKHRNGILQIIDKTIKSDEKQDVHNSGQQFLMLIKTESQKVIGVYLTDKPSVQVHSNSNSILFIFENGEYRHWITTGKNQVYAIAQIGNYSVGANRPAIILNQTLLEVSSNACQTFGSPCLIDGKYLPIGQTEGVSVVEIVRFL
ncbi:TLD domain-containing protein [Spironucleus salmonicida]|uniref:TLD domain-containing protein n=1 Tax=Spironucleus salmonicida TaxID=348837 RepID=V6LVP6_9EUKA|nr:TLD domain-containing protein [Spironucleus salmonicida]|eukprot:EST47771.1 TLD domain-containing protein [Spironucleus salmonicida]